MLAGPASGEPEGLLTARKWRRCVAQFKGWPHIVDAIASQRHRFLYVDNVKAGSSSVRLALEKTFNVSWHWTDFEFHGNRTGIRDGGPHSEPRFSSQDFDLESIRKVFKFSIVRDPVAKFESGVHEARRQNSRLRNTSADEMLDLQLDLFARTVADGRCPTRKVVNGAIPKV